MSFEEGKTYVVTPRFKKCIEELEIFQHNKFSKKLVTVQRTWRGGSFYVTPTINELEWLEQSSMEVVDDKDEFALDNFEEWELDYTSDECACDFHFSSEFSDEEREALITAIDENEYNDWYEVLSENNFDGIDNEYNIWSGIDVELLDQSAE
jgi:hypothetical protein|tara:strand:+ start:3265 stop:3720 length:456 start_codon:yes stop_codon:yes gene_type:complete